MTPAEIAALRAAAVAATPGEWRVGKPIKHGVYTVGWVGTDVYGPIGSGYNFEARYPDAAYIAAANPAVMLRLLDRMEKLERAVEDIRDACDGHEDADDGIQNLAMRCATIAGVALGLGGEE